MGHGGQGHRVGRDRGGFFFQAEDGIRDGRVTGVQTCALPISCWRADAKRGPSSIVSTPAGSPTNAPLNASLAAVLKSPGAGVPGASADGNGVSSPSASNRRSEERRVGEEGRSRWGTYD